MFKGGMDELMKQAQKVQEDMKKAQEELEKAEITGESGAGMVKIVMNGRHDVVSVNIDSSLMSEDKEMLEDLLAAAVNDAVRRIEAHQKEKMSGLTGGMNLPPGFNFPG